MVKRHRADSHYGVARFVIDRPAKEGDHVWVTLNGRRGKETFHGEVQEILGNGWCRVINHNSAQCEIVMISQCQAAELANDDSDIQI